MRERVYLAGPMTGYPEYNFPAFRAATKKLRDQGFFVTSPVELDESEDGFTGTGEVFPHEHYMHRDLPEVLLSDEVRVLPGWFDSKGAVSEVLVARLAGISIRLYPESNMIYVSLGVLIKRLYELHLPDVPPLTGREAALYEGVPQVSTPTSLVLNTAKPATWEDGLVHVLTEMHDIMIERQDKYGPNNIKQQGLLGVLTRATDDKIERIKGALNGKVVRGKVVLDPITDGSQADDTFDDGCLDAANYIGPIMLMLKRGWWDLPREEKP